MKNRKRKKSIYDIKPTSFYDDVKFVDDRAPSKHDKEAELKRIEKFLNDLSAGCVDDVDLED